jgi:BTB/POZ domain
VYTRLVEDETFADIILECSDGSRIPACRNILGARSPVLKALLYGHFKESQSNSTAAAGDPRSGDEQQKPIIPVGYCCKVMQAIILYCGTDQVQLEEWSSEHWYWLDIIDAANYYELLDLKVAATEGVKQAILQDKCLAIQVYQYCHGRSMESLDTVQEFAWNQMIQDPQHTILPAKCAIGLNFETLKRLLRQPMLQASRLGRRMM